MRSFALLVFFSWLFTLQLVARSSIEQKSVESLKKIFGDSVTVSNAIIKLSGEDKEKIFVASKQMWQQDSVNVLMCRNHDAFVGAGFVDNVKGKTQFITYLVAIDTSNAVKDIDVLVYRESYGGEIAYASFRKQFRSKTTHDELKVGKDIKNISGATISVRAITQGVKKILATFDVIRNKLR